MSDSLFSLVEARQGSRTKDSRISGAKSSQRGQSGLPNMLEDTQMSDRELCTGLQRQLETTNSSLEVEDSSGHW